MHLDLLKIQLFDQIKKRKRYLLHIPLVVYWIVLFILTSIPTDSLPNLFGISDKLEHLGAYLILSFILTLTIYLREKNDLINKYYLISGMLISIIYGVFDEIHQYFIPGRYCEFYDFIANVLGSIIGSLLVFYMLKYMKRL